MLKKISKKLGIYNELKKIKLLFFNLKNQKSIALERKKEIAFFSEIIKHGDLVFDVGANIGEKSSVYCSLGAVVVAIEPNINLISTLKKLQKKNPMLVIENVALGEEDSSKLLYISNDAHTLSSLSPNWLKNPRFNEDYKVDSVQEVRVTTLDKLIKKYGVPHYCKIDVEGFEEFVLSGLSQPLGMISFEFVKENFNKSIAILMRLSEISKIKVNITLMNNKKYELKEFLELGDFLTIVPEIIQGDNIMGDIFVKMEPLS